MTDGVYKPIIFVAVEVANSVDIRNSSGSKFSGRNLFWKAFNLNRILRFPR